MQPKFVVVVGGVCSSLGKGVTSSSLGAVLRANGYRVTAIKIDPYINVDAGLMSPFEHGEVYVLDDGGEVDLDLGNYERTMDLHLGRDNNITTGKIYHSVIDKERRGEYLGKTVQMIPHVTNEVIDRIQKVARQSTDGTGLEPHICLIELGGTVGDIESMLFLEALRMLRYQVGQDNFCLVQCCLVPIMGCGSPSSCIVAERQKISQQCGVPTQAVLSVHTVDNLFRVPNMLSEGGAINLLTALLRLDRVDKYFGPKEKALTKIMTLQDWDDLSNRKTLVSEDVRIAIVAKYTEKDVAGKAYTGDTYLSVTKALDHAAVFVNRKLHIMWVDSAELEHDDREEFQEALQKLRDCHGILVPGGFGDRGINGKIFAANWARKNKKPFLGVCLGMQMAVVGFCREVLQLEDCTSEEFDPENRVTHVLRYMPEVSKEYMGATMVLGARQIKLQPNSVASQLYGGLTEIVERQRHRYEVNQPYIQRMEDAGLLFVGRDPTGERMEVIELSADHDHPFFLGTQFHPEFKSRPAHPSPPFLGLLLAAAGKLEAGLKECLRRGPTNHYRVPHSGRNGCLSNNASFNTSASSHVANGGGL